MSSTRKEPKSDRFPLLDVPELAICLKNCNLSVNEDDLLRPTPIFIQFLMQQILEVFLLISPQQLKAQISQESEEFEETLGLVALQRTLYQFFQDCGIYDFVLTDLTKPDPYRIRRLMSGVVNFARFREEHLDDNYQILQENNLKFERFDTLSKENTNLNSDIERLEHKNDDLKGKLDEMNEHNLEAEAKLKELKKVQESLTNEHFNYKSEKLRLIQSLEDHNYLLLESKKDLDRLKSYLVESPEIINKIISDMQNSLKLDQDTLTELETRSRKLSISIESIQLISLDLKSCLKLIQELSTEISKLNAQELKAIQFKESYEGKNLKLNEIERKIQLLNRQLKNINDKFKRTNEQKANKKEEFNTKMEELNQQNNKISNELSINETEMASKRLHIKEMSQKIASLESDYKKEYDAITLEIKRLNNHIKNYLDQIEDKIS